MAVITYEGSVVAHRIALAAAWTSADLVLKDGEIGFERDTRRYKIGNGIQAWTLLPYHGHLAIGQGAVGTNPNDDNRNLIGTITLPGNQLGPNGTLEILVAARLDATPTAPATLQIEFDGTVIADVNTLGRHVRLHRFLWNQNDEAVQIAMPSLEGYAESSAELAIDLAADTSAAVDIDVYAQLDTADVAINLKVYGLLVRAIYGA